MKEIEYYFSYFQKSGSDFLLSFINDFLEFLLMFFLNLY